MSFLILLALVCQDDVLARAVSLASANQLEEAERVLRDGAAAYPHDARFAVELAGVAWRRKQFGPAKTYLRRGLRLEPSNAYANEFLGSAYLLEGNTFAALKYLNRVRKPVIGSVVFVPEPRLRSDLVHRLPAVSAGQLLTEARLADTEHNLARLRVFGEPRFDLAPGPNNEYGLSIRAAVVAQPLSGTVGQLLPLLRGLPYQNVSLDWFNLGQRAVSLNAIGRWDANKRRIAAKYRVPSVRTAYTLWTDLRDENWAVTTQGTSFDVRSAALGGEVEFELGNGITWTPGMALSRHTFRNGGPNSSIWEIRNRIDLPRWRYVERRLTIDSSITARVGRIYSQTSSRLTGAEFDGRLHWLPQGKDDVYQVHGRLRGAALTGNLPIDALYATAMERDTDIWLRGHVGTRDGRKGNAPMGTRFGVAQTAVMRRMWQMPFVRLDAGPFFDVGNVGGVAGLGSRGFLYDTGIQAEVTLLGSFRLSIVYGRDLRDGHNVFYTAISR